MTYLIDSDVVADYLGAKSQAIDLLTTLAKEGIAIRGRTRITVKIYQSVHVFSF